MAVRVLETLAQLLDDRHCFLDRQAAVGQAMDELIQALPLEHLHRHEHRFGVDVAVEVVNSGDVRVGEPLLPWWSRVAAR